MYMYVYVHVYFICIYIKPKQEQKLSKQLKSRQPTWMLTPEDFYLKTLQKKNPSKQQVLERSCIARAKCTTKT